MIFGRIDQHNPDVVEYPFNWAVDYNDGTYLLEYDKDTKIKNDFYSIEQYKVENFGLYGNDMKFYYDKNGTFFLHDRKVDVEYHVNGNIYKLTNPNEIKNCIHFKQSYSDYNSGPGEQKSHLSSVNFGYKTLFNVDDEIQFYFQPIVCLPMEDLLYIEIKLTSNVDLDGEIVFKINDEIVDRYDAPLVNNHSGTIEWTVH